MLVFTSYKTIETDGTSLKYGFVTRGCGKTFASLWN